MHRELLRAVDLKKSINGEAAFRTSCFRKKNCNCTERPQNGLEYYKVKDNPYICPTDTPASQISLSFVV